MTYKIFTYELIIKEVYLDVFGHVNNAAYLQLFEEARWEILNENGFDLPIILERGIGPIILEANLKFLKELTARLKIKIESQLTSYERKIGRMRQVIKDAQGNVCSTLDLKFGLFDIHARKLISPTEEWLRAIKG